ncbi:MAG: NAD+ synthase [Thermodesulfobacteriota bacterium]
MADEELASLKERLVGWLRDQVRKARAEGIVVGMSGGIDSSLVAVLAKEALGDKVLGLIMPCHSDALDIEDAQAVAERFSLKVERVDLSGIYDQLVKLFPDDAVIPRSNIKPRLRMISLYYFANLLNYLVVGTGNLSELKVGYFTKYGDGGVDILPLGGLYKTQVRKLATHVGVPENIIGKPPSAGLWPGQTDEDELGISYDELDDVLAALDRGDVKELPRERVEWVKNSMVASAHKRQPPAIFQP